MFTSTGSSRESWLNSFWLMTSAHRSNPAARAISGPWSTTFVDPPIAITTTNALRNAAGVTMSRGRMPAALIVASNSASSAGNGLGAALVVGGGSDHVQWFHAEHADERLHRVVREHAAAAALARARVQREAGTDVRVGIGRELERGHEVDGLAGHGIDPGVDRSVGDHQRGGVVLEQGREGADGRLVAGDDRDDPRHVVGLEVRLGAVVDQLAARQRVAHPVGAVELAVGDTQGERRRDQPHGQIVGVDPLRQRSVHRVDLRSHAQVALAVAQRADDAPHGIVHLGDVLTQEAGSPDALDVASRIPRHELTGRRSSTSCS